VATSPVRGRQVRRPRPLQRSAGARAEHGRRPTERGPRSARPGSRAGRVHGSHVCGCESAYAVDARNDRGRRGRGHHARLEHAHRVQPVDWRRRPHSGHCWDDIEQLVYEHRYPRGRADVRRGGHPVQVQRGRVPRDRRGPDQPDAHRFTANDNRLVIGDGTDQLSFRTLGRRRRSARTTSSGCGRVTARR
jgi:hypothetical protein